MRRVVTFSILFLAFYPAVTYAALININTADAALLDTLPGIGPAKAAAIITYRDTKGPFSTIADIQNVKGIGPATYANLQNLIVVEGGVSRVEAKPADTKPELSEGQGVDSVSTLTPEQHVTAAVTAPDVANALAASGAALPWQEITSSGWFAGLLMLVVVAGVALVAL